MENLKHFGILILCQITLVILLIDVRIGIRHKWWRTIAQLYGYTIDQKVKYGFVSCFNRTLFVFGGAHDNKSNRDIGKMLNNQSFLVGKCDS